MLPFCFRVLPRVHISGRGPAPPAVEAAGLDTDRRSPAPSVQVGVAVVAYTALFTWFSLRRHASYAFGDYDLGIFAQSFWTTVHLGLPFVNTHEGGSHFAYHASPVLLLLLPFYALAPATGTLLLLQTAALALGAVPVYLLGRDLVDARAGRTFAFLYLLYFPVHGVNYHDFHETAFAPAPFLLGLWGLLTGRRAAAWAGVLLALTVREDMGVLVALMGLYGVLQRPGAIPRRDFVAWIVLGLAWSAFCVFGVLPYFGGGAARHTSRYDWLGEGPLQVVLSPLLRPGLFWPALFAKTSWEYVVGLLAPLAFLPLFGWRVLLLGVPILLLNLLSSFGGMRLFESHYAGPLIPFVFAAGVVGYARRRRGLTAACVLTVLMALLFNPAPLRLGRKVPPPDPRARAFVQAVPRTASVSAPVHLWSHLVDRLPAYVGYVEGVDLILVDVDKLQFLRECGLDTALPPLLANGTYVLEREEGPLRQYRRSATGPPTPPAPPAPEATPRPRHAPAP